MTEENIFFDTKKLKYRGINVVIGKTARIRYPELVELHDNVIVDDFVYISCGLIMKEHSFIESNCTLMGGENFKITMGKHSLISAGSMAVCTGIDFKNSLQINHNKDLLTFKNPGSITIKDHVMIGAHCTIMPNITISTGIRIGAYGFVNKNLSDEWCLYTGIPVKKTGLINKVAVLEKYKLYQQRIMYNV
jgi:galactoside O-acetyltransferase